MISDEQLYKLSTDTNKLLTQAKNLLGLHLLRFKHLVDNSDKGFDCTYAQMTRRHFSNLKEEELTTLKALRESIDTLIEKVQEAECD